MGLQNNATGRLVVTLDGQSSVQDLSSNTLKCGVVSDSRVGNGSHSLTLSLYNPAGSSSTASASKVTTSPSPTLHILGISCVAVFCLSMIELGAQPILEFSSYYSPVPTTSKPQSTSTKKSSKSLGTPAIVSVSIGCIIVVGLLIGAALCLKRRGKKWARSLQGRQVGAKRPEIAPLAGEDDWQTVESRRVEIMPDGTRQVTLSFGQRHEEVPDQTLYHDTTSIPLPTFQDSVPESWRTAETARLSRDNLVGSERFANPPFSHSGETDDREVTESSHDWDRQRPVETSSVQEFPDLDDEALPRYEDLSPLTSRADGQP